MNTIAGATDMHDKASNTSQPSVKNLAAEPSLAPLNTAEEARLLASLPGWQIRRHAGGSYLRRNFSFARYTDALRFTADIGTLADAWGHYPTLITAHLRVTVIWQAPDKGLLSPRLFALAAKTSDLA